MQFDWSTFALEVLNFFVLLWLLRRFLYRPILGVIQTRQARIEASLADAHRIEAEAVATRDQLEARKSDWEAEKTKAHALLEQEIAAERERLLCKLDEELAESKARRAAHEARECQEAMQTMEHQALASGSRFVTRLLERLASPELESRLLAASLEDMARLPAAEVDTLKNALAANGLEVVSAFPLPPEARARLESRLAELAGQPVHPVYREESALLAGLCIHAGALMLSASLRDELKFFQDVEGPDWA